MVDCPNYWRELEKDERSSNVAYFIGGGKCVVDTPRTTPGEEVLIWQGEEQLDGSFHIESHMSGQTPPEDTKFIIEHMNPDSTIAGEKYATTKEEAIDIAEKLMRL